MQQDHVAVPTVYSIPMDDSILKYEKKPMAFMKEFVKYIFLGTGLLTCPVIDISIFANSQLLDSELHLSATPEQQDSKDPKNIPDIEIMPVSRWLLNVSLILIVATVTNRCYRRGLQQGRGQVQYSQCPSEAAIHWNRQTPLQQSPGPPRHRLRYAEEPGRLGSPAYCHSPLRRRRQRDGSPRVLDHRLPCPRRRL